MVEGRSEKRNYAYDIAGRLWKVWRNDTLTSVYTYDANGNRIGKVTPTSADSGTYDAQDRMLTYSTTQGLTGSSAQYIYTANGELKVKIEGSDTTYYTYDHFGNLTKVVLPNSDKIDYLIDGQNRRIGKKINGVIVKKWIYSGQLLPVAELDSIGNVVAQFAGNYMNKNGNTYQLVTDHLGSIRFAVNVQTGEILTRKDYDEYGNVTSGFDSLDIPFGFARGLYDTQTKLVRFGARDYDASVGRWTKKDPVRFYGGSSNLYIYALTDPINKIDPTGLLNAPTHYALSYNAATAAGYPSQAANAIALASVSIDFATGSQSEWSSSTAIHAMAGRDPETRQYQSPDQARNNTEQFIKDRLDDAANSKTSGDCYKALGNALHAAQDQWASLHNYSEWHPIPGIQEFAHFVSELNPSPGSLYGAALSSSMVLMGLPEAAIRK